MYGGNRNLPFSMRNASFPPLICNCAGVCTAVQIQGGAQIVMAVGFPLSRQAAQPERILRPPHPSNTRRHQAPHDLQPQPLAAATFRQLALAAPAPAACEHHGWYHRVFQSGSGLIRSLLPGAEVSTSPLGLDPAEPATATTALRP